MKDLQYITHDLGARNDPKLMDVQMEMGGQGLAIFWCLVEMLWENDGKIPANYKSIAFALRWCKPAEVEKVVTSFGLFQVENGFITSRSASERIANKKETIQARKEAGRLGGMASRRSKNEQTQSKGEANVKQTLSKAEPINKLINKQINKETNTNNAPLTAADFYEIFFFRNLKDPAGENKRFVEYYQERNWTYLDGTPVTDPDRAAEDWKPKIPGKRFNDEALRWYKAVWNAARTREQDAADIFLKSMDSIRLTGQQLSMTFKTATAGQRVGRFILDNDLAGDYNLDFRVAN